MKGGKTHYDFSEGVISASGRKLDSSVSKAVSFFRLPLQQPMVFHPQEAPLSA